MNNENILTAGNSIPQRARLVNDEFDILRDAITRLSESCTVLAERLKPILSSNNLIGEDNTKNPEEVLPPLVAGIKQERARVNEIINRIQDLESRIEI